VSDLVVVVLRGEEVHGYIEWYDKHCIKLSRSGARNLMIYKAVCWFFNRSAH
jgi:sRNA-binding regulator protein Hfq